MRGRELPRHFQFGTVAKRPDHHHPDLTRSRIGPDRAGSDRFPLFPTFATMAVVRPLRVVLQRQLRRDRERPTMPARFERLGISFQYPDNWTLDEEDALAGGQSVTVYSPGGAFWSVTVHPPSADSGKLAEAAVEAMKQEYEELEAQAARQSLAGREMTGYDLNFYYLDLTNTAQIRCLRTDQAVYSIFCQAEDREFDQIQLVFEAMTTSLLSELKGGG